MRTFRATDFGYMKQGMAEALVRAPEVDTGQWQAQAIDDPLWVSKEITDVVFEIDIPDNVQDLVSMVGPNLPWAEDHFQERVSGVPLNPPPSSEYWPYKQEGHKDHVDYSGRFSHTYPERFWPKNAADNMDTNGLPMLGIRYNYGDLGDVVAQLRSSPLTRQAYLPVWFPEDTGAVSGQRVPCTLGYHFLLRNEMLHCTYLIRSCDFQRHFSDDVYMAARLLQWMAERVDTQVGTLTMWIGSFHIFVGDVALVRYRYKLGADNGQD